MYHLLSKHIRNFNAISQEIKAIHNYKKRHEDGGGASRHSSTTSLTSLLKLFVIMFDTLVLTYQT